MEEQRGDLRAAEGVAARGTPSAWAAVACASFVLAAAIVASARLIHIVRTEPGLPLWDEAAQGFAGLEAARALGHGHLLEFLAVLNRQVVWPFVHALLLLPGFALLGPDYRTPALVSAVLYGATAVLAFATGRAVHPKRGPWIGLVTAALLLASPLYRVFGTLGMLEMPGAFLLALTAALHVRCASGEAPRSWLVAAGVSSAALFLLKYNYGLLWLAALIVDEWLRLAPGGRASLRARAATWLRAGRLLRPAPLFLAIYVLLLAAIVVTGGWEFTAFSQHVSMRSPGNPAYALLVLVTAWTAVAIARDPAAWRARWCRLSERHRILFATIGAPLLVWFLLPWPNRVRALADFVTNRESGPSPWSIAGLLYYPRAFGSDYSPSPAVGWIVLALALVPPQRGERGARLLYVALVVGLLGTIGHHYHHPRFLFTTALLVWLNAARTLVDSVALLAARTPRLLVAPAGAVALAVALLFVHAPPEAAVRAGHRAWRTSVTLLPVMDRVLDLAALEPGRVVLLGYSYALSPGLLSWHARERYPDLPLSRLPKRPPALPAGAPEAEIAARLGGLLTPGTLVLVALPSPKSPAYTPGYANEVWADSVMEARLAGDARAVPETVPRPPASEAYYYSRRDFRVLAYRVRATTPQ